MKKNKVNHKQGTCTDLAFFLIFIITVFMMLFQRIAIEEKRHGTYAIIKKGSNEEIIAENAACYSNNELMCRLKDGTIISVDSYKKIEIPNTDQSEETKTHDKVD